MRADAADNRARLLAAARESFAADGVGVPLDAIAAGAGVGPGTLHRHFPSKEALIVAVLEADLAAEAERARRLATAGSPGALFDALDGLLDIGLVNRALKAALADARLEFGAEGVGDLRAVLADLLSAAQTDGSADPGLRVDDVLALLAGALAAQDRVGTKDRARVRGLALAGLRPGSM